MNFQNTTINISFSTILKSLLIIIGIIFLYFIRDILFLLLVVVVFASAINPVVNFLQKKKFPRTFSVLLIYIILLIIVSFSISLLVPPITFEIKHLIENLPVYSEKLSLFFIGFKQFVLEKGFIIDFQKSLESLNFQIGNLTGNLFTALGNVFGGIVFFVLIFILTFYLTVYEKTVKNFLISFCPQKHYDYLIDLIERIQKRIGSWLKGQIILCLLIGFLVYLGLSILKVEYALVLAIFAGITEFVPYIGPIIGAIPAIFLVFAQSPLKAIFVIILYVIIQQLENNLIVPKVMQKTVGLNPLVIIIAMMIGMKVGGIIGMLLAIPVTSALAIILGDVLQKSKVSDRKILQTNNRESV